MNEQQINPGFLLIQVKDMHQAPAATLASLPASIDAFMKAMGVKAQVIVPEAVRVSEVDEDGTLPECDCPECASKNLDQARPQAHDDMQKLIGKVTIALLERDNELDAEGLSDAYRQQGEHPMFTRSHWVHEVSLGESEEGYWDWVEGAIEGALDTIEDAA